MTVAALSSFNILLIPEFLWILTRKQFPDPYLIQNLYKKIRHLGLDTKRLKRTDQKNCPNWASPYSALKREEVSARINDDDDPKNNGTISNFLEHEHPFQTLYGGPSYWPPA
jgi:hypothetical protein